MNKEIIKQFRLLLKQIRIDIVTDTSKNNKKHTYRYNSIKRSLQIIEGFPDKIIDPEKQLKGYKYIGSGTMRRLKEIIKTGKLSEISNVGFMDELEKIFGIGKHMAYKLVSKYGITTIKELKKQYKENIISLPSAVIKGLKYYKQIQTKIKYDVMKQIDLYISKAIKKIDGRAQVYMCGSYRRKNEYSSDIDILVVHPENTITISNIVEHMKNDNFIIDSLTKDSVKTKYMGIITYQNILHRIDIRVVPFESLYPALIYFTGSKNFNRKLRMIAISLGYTLNEYGLYDDKNKLIKTNSEKDIFDALELEYVAPHLRLE